MFGLTAIAAVLAFAVSGEPTHLGDSYLRRLAGAIYLFMPSLVTVVTYLLDNRTWQQQKRWVLILTVGCMAVVTPIIMLYATVPIPSLVAQYVCFGFVLWTPQVFLGTFLLLACRED